MAEKKTDVLEIPKKQEDQFNYSEAIKQLVAVKKVEHEDILHKIALATAKLINIEESCKRTQVEFNQKLALERQKFEDERNKRLNDIAVKEDKLKILSGNLIDRDIAVKEQEHTIALAAKERRELYDMRVEVEKMRNTLEIELTKANSTQIEASGKLAEARAKEIMAERKQEELKTKENGLINLEQELELQRQELKSQTDNLIKIREELKPQIEELTKLKSVNETILAETDVKLKEINTKIAQDKHMLETIAIKETAIKAKDIEFATREEELLRKEMLNRK